MILLIDNYDSFSYNLYQLVGTLAASRENSGQGTEPGNDQTQNSCHIRVIRNDEMTIKEIEELQPEGIILSPGPGRPADAGICIDVVKELGSKFPILGVCLGHQAICEAYGATVSYAKELMHGKQSRTKLKLDCLVFKDCPEEVPVARYHSLAALEETLPDCLEVAARTEDGEIMAVQHREYPVYGLQFHPESILTPDGKKMLENWFELLKKEA